MPSGILLYYGSPEKLDLGEVVTLYFFIDF